MGADIFILDLLKSEVCSSYSLRMRVKSLYTFTCISARKGDQNKEEQDLYLADKVTSSV